MHRSYFVVCGLLALVVLGAGCRALKDDAPSQSSTAAPATSPTTAPAAGASAPVASPPSSPTTASPPPEAVTAFRLDLIREALGRTVLTQVEPKNLIFHKNTAQGVENPNYFSETGKFEFSQALGEPNKGQLVVAASGGYQKITTASGPQLLYLSPAIVDVEFKAYSLSTLCGQGIQLTGKVHCTLALVYGYAADTIDVSGQCMSHTNGVMDNLLMGMGSDYYKARYSVQVKGHGAAREFKTYQWSGAASLDGMSVDITQLPGTVEQCKK